jgi:hypothetical protein
MTRQSSPLRMLAKTHANALINREQYIEIRARMLRKLESKGRIDESDLTNFTALVQKSNGDETQKSYGPSDWIIIGLGLAAAAVLAYILYA